MAPMVEEWSSSSDEDEPMQEAGYEASAILDDLKTTGAEATGAASDGAGTSATSSFVDGAAAGDCGRDQAAATLGVAHQNGFSTRPDSTPPGGDKKDPAPTCSGLVLSCVVPPTPRGSNEGKIDIGSADSFPGGGQRMPANVYRSLVETAKEDPCRLTPEQMRDLAAAICQKGTEYCTGPIGLSELCVSIAKRDESGCFLEALLHSCDELFNREYHSRMFGGAPHGRQDLERWRTFVIFVSKLVLAITSAEKALPRASLGSSFWAAALLCDCCEIMIPSQNHFSRDEISCLGHVIRTAGKAMGKAAPFRLQGLVSALREAASKLWLMKRNWAMRREHPAGRQD